MYRLLVVEDDEPTRRRIREEVEASIPDAKIETAASFEEAQEWVRTALAEVNPFDVVILDIQLPKGGGLTMVTDELCGPISAAFPQALVIHCTAYGENEVVRAHLEEAHWRWARRAALIVKHERWDKKLIQSMVDDRVKQGLSSFFSAARGGPLLHRRGGGTFQLASLTSDIERFWHLLPQDTQEQILKNFDKTEKNGHLMFTLGGKADAD
jgi:CheY-like chemotaxis protein